MKFRIPAFRSSRHWLLAGAVACGTLLAPLPAQESFVAPVRAAESEPVPLRVRESIDRALEYLKAHQKPDGSFEQGPAAGSTAVPALCVLAFLARGNVPGQGKYGDVIYKSIDYVLDSQQPDGLVSRHTNGNHVMYEHGIASVMLAECYGMVDDARRARIGKALAKSADVILKAQHYNGDDKRMPYKGGWRYQVNSPDADISVTGWQMMALRGAANCGAIIPEKNLEDAREYIQRSASPGGGFGYQPGAGPNQARTGTGILMMELFRGFDKNLPPGEHPKEALAAGDWLLANPPDNPSMEFYYYGIYYCSQALNQLGGKYWDQIYAGKGADGKGNLRDTLLGQQDKDGSFGGSNGQEQQAGPCYRTAMACLALCVPYRYLPIYQNDN